MWDLPEGLKLFDWVKGVQELLRLRDISVHTRSLGFPENHPPMKTFLATPIRHRGEAVGNIYLAGKEAGQEFTREDEETLVMFASQAALVVANARTALVSVC